MHDVHLKKLDGLGNMVKPDELYYVQDRSPPWGDCARWWRPDGAGYTCVIEEAGFYTGRRTASMRETDIPWPMNVVRALTRSHVTRDALEVFARERARVGEPKHGG